MGLWKTGRLSVKVAGEVVPPAPSKSPLVYTDTQAVSPATDAKVLEEN
jgi:hypothetical protein